MTHQGNNLRFIPFLLLGIFFFNSNLLAQDASKTFGASKAFGDNGDLIKEIESDLLFDNDARSRSEVYLKNQSLRKSDYVIDATKSSINASKEKDSKDGDKKQVSIVVTDTKSENFDLREKEKLAYNASLIGQYEVAIQLYKDVLKAEPNNQYSKFALAVNYQKIGQNKQAKKLYRELMQSDPERREEVVGNLLAVLIEESPKDSMYLLSRLTAQNPNSAYILARAAFSYDKLNKSEEALLLMRRAIEIDPDNLSYKYNLAVMSDKANKIEEAVSMYNDILSDESKLEDIGVSSLEVETRLNTIKAKL